MKIFDILLVPMGWLIRLAYSLTNNYLLAVMLFTLVMEVILCPIQIKQQKNQIAQAKLQPKVRAITKKYDGRNDQASNQKKQQEIMDLYQKENFNMMGGCLPMLIQLPIILCLYQVIIRPLRYITGLSSDAIDSVKKALEGLGHTLGAGQQAEANIINLLRDKDIFAKVVKDVPDIAGKTLPDFSLFGSSKFNLGVNPDMGKFGWLWIVPLLVFVTSYLSMVLIKKLSYQPPESADAQNGCSMKLMNIGFPLLSTWIAFSVPAAIGIYWAFRSVLSVVEKYILCKVYPIPEMTEAELKAAEREYGAKNKKAKTERDPNKPAVRSLHRIDFDDEPLPPPTPDPEPEEDHLTKLNGSPIDAAPLKDEDKDN